MAKKTALAAAREEKEHEHIKALGKDDKKKTNVGRWLQKYYLDELPQLSNVFKRDRSVVRRGLTGLVQADRGVLQRFDGGHGLE